MTKVGPLLRAPANAGIEANCLFCLLDQYHMPYRSWFGSQTSREIAEVYTFAWIVSSESGGWCGKLRSAFTLHPRNSGDYRAG